MVTHLLIFVRVVLSMLGARLQLRRRCVRCCSHTFSSEQAAKRSSSQIETSPPSQQQFSNSTAQDKRSEPHGSSSEHAQNSSLPTMEEQAEMNFEILAVMSKSNARFATRQHITADETEEDEEQNEKKHLAPQHRRFLSHPQIGAGITETLATTRLQYGSVFSSLCANSAGT